MQALGKTLPVAYLTLFFQQHILLSIIQKKKLRLRMVK